MEEPNELRDFGFVSQDDLVALLERKSQVVIGIDRCPMSKADIRGGEYFFGKQDVAVRLREKRCFTFSGLLRIAMELEFGDSFRFYADNRDGIR